MAETFELEMFEFEGIQAQSLWIATFGKQQDASTSILVSFKRKGIIVQSSQMYCQSIGKARAEQSWLWPDLVSMSPGASRTPRISPFLTPVAGRSPV